MGPEPTEPAPQLHVAEVPGLRRPLSASFAAASGQPEPGSDGMKMVAGSRMRERRLSGSERGQGVNRGGKAFAIPGCGGSLTNTQEDGGGSPAGLAKNQRTHAMPTDTRDPALLALTLPGQNGALQLI